MSSPKATKRKSVNDEILSRISNVEELAYMTFRMAAKTRNIMARFPNYEEVLAAYEEETGDKPNEVDVDLTQESEQPKED